MGGDDDPRTGVAQPLQGGQRRADAPVVGDGRAVEGDVQVGAYEHAPTLRRIPVELGDQIVEGLHSLAPATSRRPGGEVDKPVAVTPLVVVPAHDLHQVADHLRQPRVVDARRRVGHDVAGHDRRVGVGQVPLERAVGRRAVRRLDLLHRHLTPHLHGQVRRRTRRRGHPDRVPVELALQLRHDQPDRLGRTRARRHHVQRRRPRPPQVLVRPVLQVLIRRVGVDRGHQTPLDPRQVVEHLRQRRQAVRRARRVRDDLLGAVVVAVVDPHHQREVRTRSPAPR